MYKLIFQSKAPKAQEFSDWVTDDVLPQIREKGEYKTNNQENLTREFLDNLLTLSLLSN